MASKRRLRRKQCDGKMQHPSLEGAFIAIKMLHRRYGHQGQMRAYLCQFCHKFHKGHAPGRNGIGSGWR
ncbi:hypothetical protein [Buttiauxella gaviniae]|uniref:hypothetical protein n=1 Tax=Buttiauxella gaviniae TaxID=82990 RepID=UPI00397548DF